MSSVWYMVSLLYTNPAGEASALPLVSLMPLVPDATAVTSGEAEGFALSAEVGEMDEVEEEEAVYIVPE